MKTLLNMMEKNKTRHFVLFVLLISFFVVSCRKEAADMHKDPKLTDETLEIFATRVDFSWKIDYPGKFSSQVEISLNEDMSDAVCYGSVDETTGKKFSATADNLKEATKYYYRFVVRNPQSHYELEVKNFMTKTCALPSVVVFLPKNITSTTAIGRGEVIDNGNDIVTERGICWGLEHDPDTSATFAHCVASTAGMGSYSVDITGLTEGQTYYVRAYAVNCKGIGYSEEVSFIPKDRPGSLDGLFSVSAGKQVYFSQGNLQYQASSGEWRFAEHQYDIVGDANSNISSNYNGWIDLFGWGTSGWNSGAVCYQPWSTNHLWRNYLPGNSYTNNLTGNYVNADWGVYNAISNGGDKAGLWRTLTKSEWVYVFNTRNTSSSIRYVKACVNNRNGVILLPDDWNSSYYSLSNTDMASANFSSNIIAASQWAILEQHGAVFLPAAGFRSDTSVISAGSGGYYNSTTSMGDSVVGCVFFDSKNLTAENVSLRGYGHSVRLVRNAQ